jgi:replicative DNA helicase
MAQLNTLNAYGSGFQVKVLSSLLKHKEFLQTINDVVEPEMFDSPASQWIVKEVLRYYYKYHTTPSIEFLQVEVKKIDNEVLKVSVAEQVKEALKAANEDRDYIEQEFSGFCKNQQLKKALLSSVDLLGKGQFEDIRSIIDQALKAGADKNIGHEYDKDIEQRYREDDRAAIPTPWTHITEHLMGGLGRGDLGLVFGGPGSGKSWFLVNLGAFAVQAGYTVAHYTLELSDIYTGKRYDSVFTGVDFKDVHNHRETVDRAVQNLPGKLIVKEFPMGKTTVNTIESHIRKCADLGHKPDLIIIDYIDLLKSNRRSADIKDEIDDVYTAIKGLARELNTPIWSVSQVNRAGAKDDIVEGDKAAGSYNKIMIADFIMSLSRKRADKLNKTGRVHVMKNRYGQDGMTYNAQINTDNGSIKIDDTELTEEEIQQMQAQTNAQFKVADKSSLTFEEKSILSKKFFELSK